MRYKLEIFHDGYYLFAIVHGQRKALLLAQESVSEAEELFEWSSRLTAMRELMKRCGGQVIDMPETMQPQKLL